MGECPSITTYRKLRDEVNSVSDSFLSMKTCTIVVGRSDGTTLTFPLDPLEHYDQVIQVLKRAVKAARDAALEEAVDGE